VSDLEKYIDRVIEHRPNESALGPHRPDAVMPMVFSPEVGIEGQEPQSPNVLAGIGRRWYIALAVFVLLAGIGIPALWFFVEPGYVVTGYIRVAPVLQDILTGNPDAILGAGNYEQFANTQAMSITSPAVLERVVDDLNPKNLVFFKGDPNSPVDRVQRRIWALLGESGSMDRLKRALSSEIISIKALRGTELIAVSMKSMRPQEASLMVDSFIRNYMAIYAYGATKEEEGTLRLLESQKNELQVKMQQENQQIRQLAQEYGSTSLGSRQDMMVQRVTALLADLTRLEASRITLEADLQVPDPQDAMPQAVQPVDANAVPFAPVLAARNQYVNSEPMVQELTRRIVALEQELILAKQTMAPENPAIKQQEQVLDTFRTRLDKKRQEIGQDFDKVVSEQKKVASDQQKVVLDQADKSQKVKVQEKRLATQTAIERIKAQENRLKQILTEQDTQAKQVGRTSLDIQDLQFQIDLDKELHDSVSRRIKELQMQGKRDPRISVHAQASIERYEDKRIKYTAAVAFGALGCGCLLAFLRDKADKRLKTPDEASRRLGLAVIGTIPDSKARRSGLSAEQMTEDYQTIRTNLGIMGNGRIPPRLAVTSPGTKEGKTTFSVNLATSLARSGKRVLLIDGDLRKPDVAGLLGISTVAAESSTVVAEDGFSYTLCPTSSAGLDVLVPNTNGRGTTIDPYEIVISPDVAQRIDLLAQNYDHLIFDTPPVLAFPDALIWARIAGSVVVVSFMGRTTTPDLAEAKLRLAQSRAQILGTVMNNVRHDLTYNRYRYGYYSSGYGTSDRRVRHARKRLLLPIKSVPKKEGNSKAQPCTGA